MTVRLIAVEVARERTPPRIGFDPAYAARQDDGTTWAVRSPGIYAARDAIRSAILGELSPRDRATTTVIFV